MGLACRLDLDDLQGEMCLIEWGSEVGGGAEGERDIDQPRPEPASSLLMQGRLSVTLARELSYLGAGLPLARRLVPLEGRVVCYTPSSDQ